VIPIKLKAELWVYDQATRMMRRVPEETEISEPPYYTCPRCGLRSYNPNDIEQRYCVQCHEFEVL